jgi:hypothetical protein
MRGKKAKLIRKLVYGPDFSPKFRSYTKRNGIIRADERRGKYQLLKRISTQ